MDETYQEVNFWQYCKTCHYQDLKEEEFPCCDCLEEPLNIYSHKPVKWKEREES